MAKPFNLSPEFIAAICERIAAGESVRSICRDPTMPDASTVFKYLALDAGFAQQYARAKEAGIEAILDEASDIADEGTNDWMKKNDPANPGYALNGEHVQRSRLRIDTRKWFASKLLPKKYGDRQEVHHSGSVDLATTILDARKRSGG